ncbi:probable sodium-coupled neutral amino acid transporter 6 isoform X1 [Ananas comosus]|nr:probable sodium-coupled neutral amino acid transporter 6 isoform X1 [Ananas comosus]XP_020114822.1 probable sodium-coupled neutral amino acid transporter 6 isoform X1 [Ananas comosus]XP_020114830.1 probable sodium-coupled neutral amino acid transporter 6 isoform X1 [Ananas comosus]
MTTGSFNPVEKRGNRKNKPVLDDNSPLLPTKQDKDEEVNEFNGASIAGAVFNLSTTIVGAGIMALPATMKVLGIIPGLLMIIFGAFLTQASIEMLIRSSRVGKATSYGEVMCDAFGKIGQTLLQVCVIVNNVGVMTVYMIIIGDVLSGTSTGGVHHFGVLEGWFGERLWNHRSFVLLLTTVIVFTPLSCFKHVDSLKYTSAVSVALAVVFVAITAGVAIVKLLSGSISMPRLFPDLPDLASVWKLFTAVPILVTAYICHYNVHTIDNELEDSSQIRPVVRTSLLLCSTVYITTSFFGFLLFGESTLDDVLANFDSNLGIPYSSLFDDIVRVSYAIHLMLVFPIIFHALRLNLDGLLFPSARPLYIDNQRFAVITAALLSIIFLAANFIPSIWDAFQFTGATAAACIAFIFPAAITLRDRHGIATKWDRVLSVVMIVLAVFCNAVAVYSDASSLLQRKSDAP